MRYGSDVKKKRKWEIFSYPDFRNARRSSPSFRDSDDPRHCDVRIRAPTMRNANGGACTIKDCGRWFATWRAWIVQRAERRKRERRRGVEPTCEKRAARDDDRGTPFRVDATWVTIDDCLLLATTWTVRLLRCWQKIARAHADSAATRMQRKHVVHAARYFNAISGRPKPAARTFQYIFKRINNEQAKLNNSSFQNVNL